MGSRMKPLYVSWATVLCSAREMYNSSEQWWWTRYSRTPSVWNGGSDYVCFIPTHSEQSRHTYINWNTKNTWHQSELQYFNLTTWSKHTLWASAAIKVTWKLWQQYFLNQLNSASGLSRSKPFDPAIAARSISCTPVLAFILVKPPGIQKS